MAWQATFDVITSWPFMRPPWKTGGKSLYALVPFWSWNTLQHYLVDVMMKQKSFLVQGNLNFALMYRNNIEFSVFFLCHWVDCEIYWEYGTASHSVFWKPWPVTGHIATAKHFTRKLIQVKKITLSLHGLYSLHGLRFNMTVLKWTRGKKIAQSFLSTAKFVTKYSSERCLSIAILRWENTPKGFLKFCKLVSNLVLGQIIVSNLTNVHKLAA